MLKWKKKTSRLEKHTRADSAGTARWRRGRPGNRPNPVASNVGVLIFFEQPDQVTSDSRIESTKSGVADGDGPSGAMEQ
jgi:hypothetical protein